MTKQDMVAIAKSTAEAHGLFPHVVCGICDKESSWNPWETRFEPAWYNRDDWDVLLKQHPYPKLSTWFTERVARSMSWGLMQGLGQSIREVGFQGWLSALCDPATGLEWGCTLFELKMKHADGNVENALLLWNGGGDKTYPGDVLNLAEAYK